MKNYLSTEDFKRLIEDITSMAPLFDSQEKEIVLDKKNRSEFESKTQAFQHKLLRELGADKDFYTSRAFLTTKNINGKGRIVLDANIFISIFAVALFIDSNSDKEYKDAEDKYRQIIVSYPLEKQNYINKIREFNSEARQIEEDIARVADDYYSMDKEEYTDKMKELIRREIEILKVIIRGLNGLNSKEQEQMRTDFKVSRKNLKWLYENFDLIMEKFNEPLPDELIEYIDYDKFLLFTSYMSFASVYGKDDEEKKYDVYNFMPFMHNYKEYAKFRKEHDKYYNPKFKLLYNDKKPIIDCDKVIMQTEELEDFFKDKDISYLTFGELLDTKLIDLKESLIKEEQEKAERLRKEEEEKAKLEKEAKIRKEKEEREEKERIEKQRRQEQFIQDITLGWEFIPEVAPNNNGGVKSIYKKETTPDMKREKQDKIDELLNKKIELFQDLPYVATLRGINHFDGYIAYVFSNGKVIFEKFYRRARKSTVPTYNEAIYVMGIESFTELSRQSKGEIREFIKEGKDPYAKVINHTDTFMERVRNEVENIEYSKEVMEYIDSLVNSKSKVKVYE